MNIAAARNSGKKKCRLSYSITFKLSAVRYAEVNGNRATARYLGINEKQIRDWRAKKLSLMSTNCNAKRLKGAGRQSSNEFAKIKSNVEKNSSRCNMQGNKLMNRIHNIKTERKFLSSNDSNGWLLNRWRKDNHHNYLAFMHRSASQFSYNAAADIGNGYNAVDAANMFVIGRRYDNGSIDKNMEKEFHERITCALALLDLKTAIVIH
eukprot:gene14111-15586_t